MYEAKKRNGKTCPEGAAFFTKLIFDNDYIKAVHCISRARVLLTSYRLEKKLARVIDTVDVEAIIKDAKAQMDRYIRAMSDTHEKPAPGSTTVCCFSLSVVVVALLFFIE